MKNFYFPWSWTKLAVQATADAFGPVSVDEWRVTSRHELTQPGQAVAMTTGTIFVQQSEEPGQLNLLLRPAFSPSFLARPIRYIIYRGISRSSLVAADGTTLQNDPSVPLLERLWADQDSAGQPPTVALLGLDTSAPAGSYLQDILNEGVSSSPVKAGESLGEWAPGKVGLEIVLAERSEQTTLADLQLTEKVLTVTPPAASGASQHFSVSQQREQLLAYIDPCPYFATLLDEGALRFVDSAPPDLNQLKSRFANRDLLTIDICNEHGHSLNFYRNYGPGPNDPAPLKASFGNDPLSPVNYQNESWPLLRVDMSGQDANHIRLQLIRADNPSPAIRLAQGRFGHFSYREITSLSPDANDPSFTEPVSFKVPRRGDAYVPGWLQFHYLRPVPGPVPAGGAAYRPLLNTLNEAIFDLSELVGSEGLRLPQETADEHSSVHLNLGRVRLIVNGSIYLGELGIARDQVGVYLFVLPLSRRLAEQATGSFLSPRANLWEDSRFVRLFGLESVSSVSKGTAPAEIHLPQLRQVPGLRSHHYLLALTHDEWGNLLQSSPLWADPLSLKWLHVEPAAAPAGIQDVVATKLTQSLRGLDSATGQLSIVDHGEAASPIHFYADAAPATTLWFSDAFLATAFSQPVGRKVDRNRADFAASYCIRDTRVILRSTPEVRLISKSDWEEANGDETVLNNRTNAIGQTPGYRPVPITIIGKRRVNDQEWFLVELLGETELIKPSRITSNYDYTTAIFTKEMIKAPFPARGNLFSAPAGTMGWVAGFGTTKESVYKVATFSRFLKDLETLLNTLSTTYPADDWQATLTRLRRLTKERYPNVGLPSLDDLEKEGVIGRMFDLVIGTVREDSTAEYDYSPTVTPALGLESIDYQAGETTTHNGHQIDTCIQLFRDYMGVRLAPDTVLDLHHLFVGLDAHSHRKKDVIITRLMLLFAFETEADYFQMDDDFKYRLMDNAHQSLWAGDLGAIYTNRARNSHEEFEKDWELDNPRPGGPAEAWKKKRLAAFRDHYFRGLAGSADLYADLLSYRLFADIKLIVRNRQTAHVSLVRALTQMWEELNVKGPSDYMAYFADDLEKKDHPYENAVQYVEELIIEFSKVFEMRKREAPELAEDVVREIESEIRTNRNGAPDPSAIASRFLQWLADHGGPDLLASS